VASLRELRTKARLSREQLAHRAGLTASGLYKVETGRSRPGFATIQRLADALGVPITDIDLPVVQPKKDAA
jgi:transcriptional regulator with XRE-family HTH domain